MADMLLTAMNVTHCLHGRGASSKATPKDHHDCLPSSEVFEAYAEGLDDMQPPRVKLLEILDSLGDTLPTELKHVRREVSSPADSLPRKRGRQDAATDKTDKGVVKAGPSHAIENRASAKSDTTEFEAEWARLPSAITALPSFCNIQQLILRNSTGKTSFRHSLPVVRNGLDYCFLSRPTFRQLLIDLERAHEDALTEPAEAAGLLPPHPDPLAITEALWESHFGVPRDLRWHTALAQYDDGVSSCIPVVFKPPNPGRLGLTCISVDTPGDVGHCAVAGCKRHLCLVGPAFGILYTVVQGSLLLISWPATKHNFDMWLNLSRSVQTSYTDHLEEFEGPDINVLRTGDAIYLAAGTINVMVSLSHVALTSRRMHNSTSKEFDTIVRSCNHLVDSYIEQQKLGYWPFDELEVDRMDLSISLWLAITEFLETGKSSQHTHCTPLPKAALQKAKLSVNALKRFASGLGTVQKKIEQYREMVHEAAGKADERNKHGCPRNRAYDTLNALAWLSQSGNEFGGERDKAWIDEIVDGIHHTYLSGHPHKGKDRVPS